MDKVDKIISIIRQIREESGGMTTGSSGSVAGFSASADHKGPVAGYDKPLDGRSKPMRRLPLYYRQSLQKTKAKK